MRRPFPLRPSLSRSLRRSARTCRRLVGGYPDAAQVDNAFAEVVTAAITAMESAAVVGRERDEADRRAVLAATADACGAAAEACRAHGLDHALLRAADSFDRAAALCARDAA